MRVKSSSRIVHTMDAVSCTDEKHSSLDLNIKNRSSMDELCNFEVNQLYANRDTNALTDAHINEENKDLPVEISHQEPTYYERYISNTGEVCHIVDEDESMKTPLRVTHECANWSPNQSKSPVGSSVSEDISISTGYSGSTLSEYDTDECNSRNPLKCASLITGKDIEDSSPGNICLYVTALKVNDKFPLYRFCLVGSSSAASLLQCLYEL